MRSRDAITADLHVLLAELPAVRHYAMDDPRRLDWLERKRSLVEEIESMERPQR